MDWLCLLLFMVITIGGMMRQTEFVFNADLIPSKRRGFLRAFATEISKMAPGNRHVKARLDDVLTVLESCGSSTARPDLLDVFKRATAAPKSEDYHGFYSESMLAALIKKNADLNLGIDTKAAALEAFWRSERKCAETNRVLRDRTDPLYKDRAALIFKMQRKIARVLGSVPNISALRCGFGPGNNVGCSEDTSVRSKLTVPATTTARAMRLLAQYMASTPQATLAHCFSVWPGLAQASVVSGSRWTAVPKNAVTDRGISVEPIVNTFLQKGIGRHIRRRLKDIIGIDLTDQSLNQWLALLGSKDGSLATIDLSMASDTIASILVLELLPYEWFELLYSTRSHLCDVDGKTVSLNKFSSMGNGYTFELESLIFWALTSVACDDLGLGDNAIVSVYGDDIICPTEASQLVFSYLKLLGFEPNAEKSFTDPAGRFRESCGKDYLGGLDVRPIFIKDPISCEQLYRVHNWALRNGLPDLATVALKFIKKSNRIYGPDGFGDGHLISDNLKIRRDKRGREGYVLFKTFKAKSRVRKICTEGDFGAFLFFRCNSEEQPDYDVNTSKLSWDSYVAHLRNRWVPDEECLPFEGFYQNVRTLGKPAYRKGNIKVPVGLLYR